MFDDTWQEDLEQAIGNIVQDFIPGDEEAQNNSPYRVSKSYSELLSGYTIDPKKIIGKSFEIAPGEDLVIVKDINFFSLCKHHFLPFFGKVHVGYLPNGKVIGLSKVPRLVKCLSQRLQLQEGLCRSILNTIQESELNPKGVIVVAEAQHMCMQMRGIQAVGSVTTTSSISGEFETNNNLKGEFYQLIGR